MLSLFKFLWEIKAELASQQRQHEKDWERHVGAHSALDYEIQMLRQARNELETKVINLERKIDTLGREYENRTGMRP